MIETKGFFYYLKHWIRGHSVRCVYREGYLNSVHCATCGCGRFYAN